MRAFEFYPLRWTVGDYGWRIYLVEIVNFRTASSWHLLGFGWDREAGFILNWGGVD